jgi:hypothetical protein
VRVKTGRRLAPRNYYTTLTIGVLPRRAAIAIVLLYLVLNFGVKFPLSLLLSSPELIAIQSGSSFA